MKENSKSWLKVIVAVSLSLVIFGCLCAILVIGLRHGQIEWAKVADEQKNAIATVAYGFCRASFREEGLYFPPRDLTFTVPIPRQRGKSENERAYIGVGFSIDLVGNQIPPGEQRDRLTNLIRQWSQNTGFVEDGQEGTQYALYVTEYDIDWIDPNSEAHTLLITVKQIQKKPIPIPSVSTPEKSHTELIEAVKSGKPEDFYQLGLSYLHGGSGIINLVEAYYWLSRAAASNSPQHALYANRLNWVRGIMKPSQLEDAESLLRERHLNEP